jgi:acetyltransferase
VSGLLKTCRDVPATPLEAVELTHVELAQMAVDSPEHCELEIHPLLADEHGVMAIDARVGIGAARDRAA